MMRTCPNCSETLGNDVRECPFCKHVITDQELKKAESIDESLHEQAVESTISEYGHRLKKGFVLTVIFIAIIIGGGITLAALKISQEIIFFSFFVALAVYFIVAWKLRIGFCPYCESMMGRGIFLRNHCPRCGGRLR